MARNGAKGQGMREDPMPWEQMWVTWKEMCFSWKKLSMGEKNGEKS